jgi:hypothetical protein
MTMQFEKTSTGATPIFPGAPKGVLSQDSGRVNSDPRTGSAGGEVRRSEILDRAGSLGRRSLAGHR